jgi:hypothetical protein
LNPVRIGLCVGGPLDGQVRSIAATCIAFETYVPVEAEAGPPTALELLDPLAALKERMRLDRVRYVWRSARSMYATTTFPSGQWVYEPPTA